MAPQPAESFFYSAINSLEETIHFAFSFHEIINWNT